jgi:SAM-dependent methyltransferase
MNSYGYEQIAAEYYDAFHKTCRNFDVATKAALATHPVQIAGAGLVLEVGCGRGRAGEFLGIPEERIIQLDVTREMLALEPREKSILRIHADATSVPIFDAQFEYVVGFLIDPFIGLAFFAEAYRLLKPGGILVATTPSAEWGFALRGRVDADAASTARFITKKKETVEVPSTLVPVRRIEEMLLFSGFHEIETYSQALPAGTAPISPDVETAAIRARVDLHDLPLIDLIKAVKRP